MEEKMIFHLESFRKEKRIVLLLLGMSGIFFLWLAFTTKSQLGGGDNISHYKIAHFAWQYPHLFLHHWGKPVFTLLSAPFAAAGFIGMRVYNILVGLLSAYLGYRIAWGIGLKNSWIIILLILFTPMYFPLLFGALTEPTFGLFLLLSVYLIIRKKYFLSAFILSFIFLVRTEGFLLYPLFILLYIFRRQYKAIPLLLSGFIIYSIIGYFHYYDIWWLINEIPYHADSSEVYGQGNLFSFVQELDRILGYPHLILFLTGIIVFFVRIRFRKLLSGNSNLILLLLVVSFFTYFVAHSYVWWQGTGGSAGLIRVIGAVTPASSFLALYGLNFFTGFIRQMAFKRILFATVLALYVFVGYETFKGSFKIHSLEKTLKQTSHWLKTQNLNDRHVVYFMEFVWFYADMNPYNKKDCSQGGINRKIPSKDLDDGDVVVWDSYIAPSHYNMARKALEKDPQMKLIKRIQPSPSFNMNGKPFFVDIYMKTTSPITIPQNEGALYMESYENELEYHVTDSVSFHGKKSLKARPFDEFISGFSGKVKSLTSLSESDNISISIKIQNVDKVKEDEVLLVRSVERQGKILNYRTIDFVSARPLKNGWKMMEMMEALENFPEEAELKIYLWNKGRKKLFVDDFRIH